MAEGSGGVVEGRVEPGEGGADLKQDIGEGEQGQGQERAPEPVDAGDRVDGRVVGQETLNHAARAEELDEGQRADVGWDREWERRHDREEPTSRQVGPFQQPGEGHADQGGGNPDQHGEDDRVTDDFDVVRALQDGEGLGAGVRGADGEVDCRREHQERDQECGDHQRQWGAAS